MQSSSVRQQFIDAFPTRTWHLPSVCSECRLVDTSKLATPATFSVMCRRTTGALTGPMTIRIPFKTLVHGPQRRVGHDFMWADTMRLFILIPRMRLHYIHVAIQQPADTGFSRWGVFVHVRACVRACVCVRSSVHRRPLRLRLRMDKLHSAIRLDPQTLIVFLLR